MPESERKEPGHADVVHRERGDLRQQPKPVEPPATAGTGEAQDRAPAGSPRDEKSPWLGGG